MTGPSVTTAPFAESLTLPLIEEFGIRTQQKRAMLGALIKRRINFFKTDAGINNYKPLNRMTLLCSRGVSVYKTFQR